MHCPSSSWTAIKQGTIFFQYPSNIFKTVLYFGCFSSFSFSFPKAWLSLSPEIFDLRFIPKVRIKGIAIWKSRWPFSVFNKFFVKLFRWKILNQISAIWWCTMLYENPLPFPPNTFNVRLIFLLNVFCIFFNWLSIF